MALSGLAKVKSRYQSFLTTENDGEKFLHFVWFLGCSQPLKNRLCVASDIVSNGLRSFWRPWIAENKSTHWDCCVMTRCVHLVVCRRAWDTAREYSYCHEPSRNAYMNLLVHVTESTEVQAPPMLAKTYTMETGTTTSQLILRLRTVPCNLEIGTKILDSWECTAQSQDCANS